MYHSSSRPSWETKAIHFPSGDQAGALSVPLRATRAVGHAARDRDDVDVGAEAVRDRAASAGPAKATVWPSGERLRPVTCSLPGRELPGLPRGDVDHPQAIPGVELGGRPGVVLLLLAPPPLVALRLAGQEGDRLPVRRPLEVGDGARGLGERHRLSAVRPDEPDLALRVARVVRPGARPRPLGEKGHPPAVGRPAGRVVAHRGRGEGARLAARGGDEPDVRLVGVLLAVQGLDDVGHEPPVGGHLRVGHDPQAEDVVARPRPIAGEQRPRGGR